MNAHDSFQVYLLRKQPQVLVNGQIQSLSSASALKLFIYLADTGQKIYFRDDVFSLFSPVDTEIHRKYFRQKAVYPIRDEFSETLLKTSKHGSIIEFNSEQVWVDSRTFSHKGNQLLQQHTSFDRQAFEEALEVLALYQSPFLMQFPPPSDKRATAEDLGFAKWQKTRQHELVSLYHQLLDPTIVFALHDEQDWPEAQRLAELWLASTHPTAKPVQYLLWLTSQRRSSSMSGYLEELERRHARKDMLFGPTPAEWRHEFDRHRTITLDRLLGRDISPVLSLDPSAVDDPLDRPVIRQKLADLLIQPHGPKVFGLSGPAGAGKTEMTHKVVEQVRREHPDARVIVLELPQQLDLELLYNKLLVALDKPELLGLDVAKKRHRLKQQLQAPNTIVVVDEGHSTHMADAAVIRLLTGILAGARVMLVGRTLAEFEGYEVDLGGLSEAQTRTFMLFRVPWLEETGELNFHEFTHLTRGLPLLLHITAGGLKSQRGRIGSLMLHLNGNMENPPQDLYAVYDRVLNWLWQYLTSEEKNLLYIISLFAPEIGVSTEDVIRIFDKVMPKHKRGGLDALADLRLVERRGLGPEEERCRLHPLIRAFVVGQMQERSSPYRKPIQQAFVRTMLDYVQANAAQPDLLDAYQQNILHMFELVLSGDDHAWAQSAVIDALNQTFPYFEQRGLVAKAAHLFAQMRDTFTYSSPAAEVTTLLNIGKIAKLQSRFTEAIDALRQALARAERYELAVRYGPLYMHIGDSYMNLGQYEEAMRQFETAAQWAEQHNPPAVLYAIWSNMGVCRGYQSQYELAWQIYRTVAERLGEDLDSLSPDLKQIAQHNQTAIGLTLTELGRYEEAIPYFQRSLSLARELNALVALGYVYLNLGVAYYAIKAITDAETCFNEGFRIAEQTNHPALLINLRWNQGALASIQFNHQRAFFLLRTALMEAQDNQLDAIKPRILVAFGKAYLRCELHDAARRCFLDVLKLADVPPVTIAEAVFGLCLSILLPVYLIGQNDVEDTLRRLEPPLNSLPARSQGLFGLMPADVQAYLQQAERWYVRDMDHLPELERFRVREAIEWWLEGR